MRQAQEKAWKVRNGDRLSGALLLAFALYMTYEALQLRFGSVSRPGPGFYPAILAVMLACLSGAVLVGSLRARDALLNVSFGSRTSHIGLTIAAVIVYAAVVEAIGFLVCTFILVLALLIGLGKVAWRRALLVAAVGTVVFYVIFTSLGIPLPQGILAI